MSTRFYSAQPLSQSKGIRRKRLACVPHCPPLRPIMPHVIVKLWPGKSAEQKQRLAERITADVMQVLHYSEESVSVAFEEVEASDWRDKVFKPDIVAKQDQLYKKPGYDLDQL